MRQKLTACTFVTLALSLALDPADAAKTYVLGDGIQLGCAQPKPTQLACDYRFLEPAEAVKISGAISGAPLPWLSTPTAGGGKSAVLFLLDSSASPPDRPVFARAVGHLRAMLETLGANRDVGIATVGRDFRIDAPIGSKADALNAAAAAIRDADEPTELYRGALSAVRHLARYDAERRALFVFSDGLADDRAYELHEVVEAARANGIAIHSIGLARSLELSTALQSLRRLSEETGGRFTAVDTELNLPPTYLLAVARRLDNGGTFELNLSRAQRPGADRTRLVTIEIVTEAGRTQASVPVRLPPPVAPTSPRAPAEGENGAANGHLLWYVVLATGLAVLILLAARWRTWRAKSAEPESSGSHIAYLELQDDSHARHIVETDTYRIGRHSENELTLRDPSISRHHAEIRRHRNGTFAILDLNSMNGVYVNNHQVKHAVMSEGDLVELGDVGLRFTCIDDDTLPKERATVSKMAS